jgi:hypothetical protein
MAAMGLVHFMGQTWRSIVSFFLSFVVLGLMVILAPGWATGFVELAASFKYLVLDQVTAITGLGQASDIFALLVGDTEIALAMITLFTRVVVLTLLLWLGGLIFGRLFGRAAS